MIIVDHYRNRRAICRGFCNTQEILTKENIVIKGTVRTSELNSFISIRLIRAQTWLAGVLLLLSFPNAFAESDFSAFWKNFKSAVTAGDKTTVAEMTKVPLSMPDGGKAVEDREGYLCRFDDMCELE